MVSTCVGVPNLTGTNFIEIRRVRAEFSGSEILLLVQHQHHRCAGGHAVGNVRTWRNLSYGVKFQGDRGQKRPEVILVFNADPIDPRDRPGKPVYPQK